MAPTAKLFSLLLLLILSFSLQIEARESQFFSKVTVSNNNNDNAKETQLPTKEESVNQQQQEPTFIPSTTQTGYGLYGHATGQLPPSTTTATPSNGVSGYSSTNLPNNALPEEPLSTYDNNKNYYYNKNAYEEQTPSMSGASLVDRGYTTENAGQNNQYTGGATTSYDGEKHGMSDTRYLENGRYYYHVNKYEKSSMGNGLRNEYNNRDSYATNENSYQGNYNSNNDMQYQGNYNSNNDMQGYQNQNSYQNQISYQNQNFDQLNYDKSNIQGYQNQNLYQNSYPVNYNNKNNMQGYQTQEEFEDEFEP